MYSALVNDVVSDFAARLRDKHHETWCVITEGKWWPCPDTGYPTETATAEEFLHWKLTLSEFAFYAYAAAPDYIWAERCLKLLAYTLRSMTIRDRNYARELLRKYYEPRLCTVAIECDGIARFIEHCKECRGQGIQPADAVLERNQLQHVGSSEALPSLVSAL